MSGDDNLAHIGNRSWWDGSVTTLCGRKITKADRIVFPRVFGRTVCPACEAVKKAR
jgi:hypothetical protein